jgi:hypothetical protein
MQHVNPGSSQHRVRWVLHGVMQGREQVRQGRQLHKCIEVPSSVTSVARCSITTKKCNQASYKLSGPPAVESRCYRLLAPTFLMGSPARMISCQRSL